MVIFYYLFEYIINSGYNCIVLFFEIFIVIVFVFVEKFVEVKIYFKIVYIFVEEEIVMKEVVREVEVWYLNYLGILKEIEYEDVLNLKFV